MLKIRLQRIGRKNDPHFRIVVTDSRRGPKSGKYIEMLGSYDPHKNTSVIKGDRVTHFISNGAQVSGTVHNLLVKNDVIKGKKINVLPKKSPVVKKESSSAPVDASAIADKEAAEDKKEKTSSAPALEDKKEEAKDAEDTKSTSEEVPQEKDAESPPSGGEKKPNIEV